VTGKETAMLDVRTDHESAITLAAMEADLRLRWPQLPEPLVLPWAEQSVIALDRDTPWIYGPIERDPLTTTRGHTIMPRRQIRQLRKVAALGVPFQRLAFAHELDPGGPVAALLPMVRQGPRVCTDDIARAVAGPQPVHPGVRRTGRLLDAVVGRGTVAAIAGAVDAVLDPILFGVVGTPDVLPGLPALWYPLAVWRW
jgi:hypothetical protein